MSTVKNAHGHQITFQCSSCDEEFKSEKVKVKHEKSCKRRQYECYLGKYELDEQFTFYTHTGYKNYKFSIYPQRFVQKTS